MEKNKMTKEIKIIDVREYKEFESIQPKDESLCLPMSRYDTWVSVLSKDYLYKVICHTNNRSSVVAEWMRRDGFDAEHISNGMSQLTGGADCEACNIFTGVCKKKDD